jgi:hypothetical protein
MKEGVSKMMAEQRKFDAKLEQHTAHIEGHHWPQMTQKAQEPKKDAIKPTVIGTRIK